MMIFSYKVEHDFGLAPNPFGKYCTLAVCKPQIRRNKRLSIGDWVIGTGSTKLKNLGKLVYAMQVDERLSFETYWNDPRFGYKRPVVNGSLVQMYGDNIYHKDSETGEWLQENSAHSDQNGKLSYKHRKTDLGGENVLISRKFYYFGDQPVQVPKELEAVCSQGRNYISNKIPVNIKYGFIEWLTNNHSEGVHGDPISWRIH